MTEFGPGPDDGYTEADKENPDERPEPIPVLPDRINNRPKAYPHWVSWRFEWRNDRGEWSKPPIDPETGDYASTTDPSTWTTFDDALEYHEREDTDTDGIGFVVTDSPFSGADLDGVYDPETNEWDDAAREMIDTLGSYSEFSPSARGGRVIMDGDLPDGDRKGDPVEMYDSGRYLTITGWRIPETPDEIPDRDDGEKRLAEVHREAFPDDYNEDDQQDLADIEPSATEPTGDVDLDDEELVEIAKGADDGGKFARLWNGSTAGYPSQSEADEALCYKLAFWTGGDAGRIDRLFRQSGLMRPKWDDDCTGGGDTYGEHTIDKAVSNVTEFYDPNHYGDSDGGDSDEASKPLSCADWETVRGQYAASTKDGRVGAANLLTERRDWMYVLEEDNLWIYNEDTGVFDPWGEEVARNLLEDGLGRHYSEGEKNEVVGRLEARNQVHRSELNGGSHPGHHLCCGDGVIDLETGELLDHHPKFRFTRGLRWDYDPDGERTDPEPAIEFLDDITQREEDRDTLIDHLAHGLMPGHPYRAFIMMYGPGGNGKTQLGQLLRGFVGEENAAAVELPDLTGDDDFATGALPGAFVNIGDDVSVGEIRDVSVLKSMTGGGTMRANEKFEKMFDFENEAAMFFSANEPPRFAENKESIADRLYPIEMPYRFVGEAEYDPENPRHKEKVPGIAKDLLANDEAMRGLLQLCVEHAQRLIESNGQYSMPEGPRERRLMYEAASDPILRFVLRCLEGSDDRDDAILKDDAYDVYREMCAADDERVTSDDSFKRQISQQSIVDLEAGQTRQVTPGSEQDKCWRYVRFAEDAAEFMPARLRARYGVGDVDEAADEDGNDVSADAATEGSDTTGSDRSTTNAVPVMNAAESLTGYVTVTVEVVTARDIGSGSGSGSNSSGVKAVCKDQSGAIDAVAWDGDLPDRLFDAQGEHVAIRNVEVGEYDGKRQLSLIDGLTDIVPIEPGDGFTEGIDDDETETKTEDDAQTPTIEPQHVEADGSGEPETAESETDTDTADLAEGAGEKPIIDAIEKRQTDDGHAHIDDVVAAVPHTEEKARHTIRKLLDAGRLYHPPDGNDEDVRTV